MTTPKHIFVHIGGTKTGSSALQAYLSSNATGLEEMGITYPNPENDHIVTQGVCSGNILHLMQGRATLQGFRGTIPEVTDAFLRPVITDVIDTCRHDRVVLSGEFLSACLTSNTLDIFRQLSKMHRVTVIVFVRDVYDHAVSAWKQNVKNSGDTCDLAGFVETADQADMLQFQRLAPLLVAGLDLRVINYDHHKQSLVPRFLNEIGLSAGDGRLQELASPRKNLSLSYWQAQTVVLSHRITGLSRLTALAVNRLRQQSDGRADPYLREVDDLLLDAQRPLIQSLNRLLPRDQQLRDQPRADHGDAQVTFAEADMAALLQIFRDYAAMPSAQDAPSRQEGLPEDFDPEEYLLRYPDVAAAGMDAATHYLNHGQFEGRVYKVPAGP